MHLQCCTVYNNCLNLCEVENNQTKGWPKTSALTQVPLFSCAINEYVTFFKDGNKFVLNGKKIDLTKKHFKYLIVFIIL